MVAVRMVKVAIDEIVDMVAVRDSLMSASWSVHMARLVSGTTVVRRATIRIFGRHFNGVFVHVIGMRVVQMPVVQVVDMIAVAHRRVSAGRTMLMRVIGVMRLGALCHWAFLCDRTINSLAALRYATAVLFLLPAKLPRRQPSRDGRGGQVVC